MSLETVSIETGDTIRHKPTGEEWLVAYVDAGRVACCGWPLTLAPEADCTLTEKASEEERRSLLLSMANMKSDDPRRTRARLALGLDA